MKQRLACFVAVLIMGAAACTFLGSPPQGQDRLDRLLDRWQQWNAGVNTFQCRFKRWTYDAVFGRSGEARFVELGTIQYAAPKNIAFSIDTTEQRGRSLPIDLRRAEHWSFDGKSIVEYSPIKRQVIEHRLPPSLQTGCVVDGPLSFESAYAFAFQPLFALFGKPFPTSPFPFSATAARLNRDYDIREVTPPDVLNQVWLEALPRSPLRASCCERLQLIFNRSDMAPLALKIFQTEKLQVVYQFYDMAINRPSAEFDRAIARPDVPPGWTLVSE
jgi:hypothetical protein